MKKDGMSSHQSHKMLKDEWLTPPSLLNKLGTFDLDPCSPTECPWKIAENTYTTFDNGLEKDWFGRVWCNPPYGRETRKWLSKCVEHKNVTALIFARTETKDWIKYVWGEADSILFIYGRLYFYHIDGSKAKSNSGAPSALISYDKTNTEYLKRSGIEGKLINLK
jgi:hypothetical protein